MNNQTPSILIVDDELRIVRVLGRVLNPFYKTYLAVSGDMALEIIRNQRIHAIISYQRMPKMSGVELLSQVKMISPNTTRILLTGYSDLSAVMDSVNRGEIFRYLKKPWHNSELIETVGQACEIAQSLYQIQPFRRQQSKEITPIERNMYVKNKILVLEKSGELLQMISYVLDSKIECISAVQLETALKLLMEKDISLIVININYFDKEVLTFIKRVKALVPSVLCVVVADSADTKHLVSLINEGQIFRFIIKPLRAGQLKIYLISAIRYYNQLIECPELLARHAVGNSSKNKEQKLAGSTLNRIWSFFLRAFLQLTNAARHGERSEGG